MDRNTRILVAMAVVVIAASAAYWYTLPRDAGGEYGDVSVEKAMELIQDKPSMVILDVRTRSEFDDGHIEGAINIPVNELQSRLGELDMDDETLVYCRTGNRSSTAVGILRDNGYEKIYHLDQGIVAWTSAGYPTVR